MANMSYCRFENTASDLADCLEHVWDELPESEHKARKRLLRLAAKILQEADVPGAEAALVAAAAETADDLPIDA